MAVNVNTLVRKNLLTRQGYTPYCGNAYSECFYRLPRTKFDGEQFICKCGWRSEYEEEFIEEYKKQQEILKENSKDMEIAE